MTMREVQQVNTTILQQCREQIGLTHEKVQKKIASIIKIEKGEKLPTFKQLDTLSDLYEVPRWVFIAESLPTEYQLNQTIPAFRQFANHESDIFQNYKVRRITTRVQSLRDDIIELRQDMGEPVEEFQPPNITPGISASGAAQIFRQWLGAEDKLDFSQWKERLEDKNIFIFMTSKYTGWSYVEELTFRGLALYYPTLPIIIINDSDAHKAQLFTLFHELGHLIREESAIDDWENDTHETEKWCNEFSGNFLMPKHQIQALNPQINDLHDVEQFAKGFMVSPYVVLVRLRQTNHIDQLMYDDLEQRLKREYEEVKVKLKKKEGGPSRDRSKEVQQQYGKIYIKTLFQTYNNQEISLHKLSQALDLKRITDVFNIKVG